MMRKELHSNRSLTGSRLTYDSLVASCYGLCPGVLAGMEPESKMSPEILAEANQLSHQIRCLEGFLKALVNIRANTNVPLVLSEITADYPSESIDWMNSDLFDVCVKTAQLVEQKLHELQTRFEELG